MKLLKNIVAGFILYVAIPASLLFTIFQVLDYRQDDIVQFVYTLQNHFGSNPGALRASQIPQPALSSQMPDENEQLDLDSVQPPNLSSAPVANPNVEEDANKVPLEFADQSLNADDILSDRLNRVPDDFKIPKEIRGRVRFWFDIYSKYSSHFSVIHDMDRPWIVYRVVDLRDIYSQPVNRFTKDANDRRAVAKAKNEIRGALVALAHKKNYRHLSADEFRLYKLLENVPGSRKRVFMKAAQSVREQRGQKDFCKKGIVFSSRYINEMEEIFARYDLPVELVRLPLVESSFNENAQSKVGASGIWQFMEGTGRKFLRVGKAMDERISPIKATEAAAKLMLSNFRVLRSWPLAITAYNHGAGGLIRASKLLHTKNIADIINKYHSPSFSFASQNFYSEFLAALYGEKYQDEIYGQLPKYSPLEADTINLKYSMRARTLVDIVGITLEELKLFNPDLKTQAIAGGTFLPVGYHIRLPVGKRARIELFNQQADDARATVNKLSRKNNG